MSIFREPFLFVIQPDVGSSFSFIAKIRTAMGPTTKRGMEIPKLAKDIQV